jgi:hypothetical protein
VRRVAKEVHWVIEAIVDRAARPPIVGARSGRIGTVMEIYLDKRAVRQIRLSAADAIDEGDNETLREDIIQAFSDETIEEIERRIDSGDFYDFVSDVLDEWAAEDLEELFELFEAHLADAGIDIKYSSAGTADADDDSEEEDDEDGEEEELALDEDEDEL